MDAESDVTGQRTARAMSGLRFFINRFYVVHGVTDHEYLTINLNAKPQ
jgi:hypothetical protein